MAQQRMKHKIDGHVYTIAQLPPEQALPIYTWLLGKISIVAPGVVKSLHVDSLTDIGGIKGLMNSDIDIPNLIAALARGVMTMDDEKTIEHVKTLLSAVLFEGKSMTLNHVNFHGKMKHLSRVIIETVKVNFSDFLEEDGGLSGILGQKTHSEDTPSVSQT